LRTINAGARGKCNKGLMVCCLFIAALLTPLGLWVKPTPDGTNAVCCAHRRAIALIAVAGILTAAACLLILVLPQSAPFHHICRFTAIRG
jgi:hypothetical protein